jgi:hypothetical protein
VKGEVSWILHREPKRELKKGSNDLRRCPVEAFVKTVTKLRITQRKMFLDLLMNYKVFNKY